nr:ABC transporter permease [uncultured Agathobaculum sp.]
MFIRSVRAEFLKLRRSFIWLAMLALPMLSAGLGTANYLNNLGMLTEQWYSLWTQHALFYCTLFAPALTGVYCAYICRLEHLNRNWNAVMTQPVPVSTMLAAKLTVVSVMTALTQLFIGILFIISGKIAGLTAPIPFELVYWILRGWWALTVQASLLLCIALIIRSFAVPVAAGILGGFCGLPALVKGFGVYFPFSLLELGMCSHNPSEPMDCSAAGFLISSILYLLLGFSVSVLWMRKQDVKTT